MTTLFTIGILLLILGFISKISGILLRPREKKAIRAGVSNFSAFLKSNDPRIVIQAPLRFAVELVDRLFGKRFFSRIRLFRAALFGSCLFTFSIGLSSLQSGNLPFPLEDSPWRTFDRSFESIVNSGERLLQDKKQPPKEKEALTRALREVNKLRNSENRWIYSILFFPSLALAAVVFISLSLSFARRVLVEMSTANNLFSLLALGALCLILLPCFYAVGFAALYSIASPIVWLTFIEFEKFGLGSPIVAASIVVLFALVLALFTASAWLKLLVSTVILPVTATIIIWIFALLLFFVRKPLHWSLSQSLKRVLSSKSGLFATCASVFAASGVLVVAIARILSGQAPW